jgi:hypothetical protein
MGPVVAATLIRLGGAVIVAVVGLLTTRSTTSQTINAAATAGREGAEYAIERIADVGRALSVALHDRWQPEIGFGTATGPEGSRGIHHL